MNIDVATIGFKTHQYNQDYGLISRNRHGCDAVIVCDGCSSTEHSDISSRLTAAFVYKYISRFGDMNNIDFKSLCVSDLLAQDIAYTPFAHMLPISHCLDSTALIITARTEDNIVGVRVFGDGYIIIKYRNGFLIKNKIESENGYPPYLSYIVDDKRMKALEKIGNCNIVRHNEVYSGNVKEKIWEWSETHPFSWPVATENYPIKDIEYIMVCTDGIDSINNVSSNEVLDKLTQFKTTTGQFMQRRLKAMMKDYAKNGQTNSDDLTVGIIHFGDVDESN